MQQMIRGPRFARRIAIVSPARIPLGDPAMRIERRLEESSDYGPPAFEHVASRHWLVAYDPARTYPVIVFVHGGPHMFQTFVHV